MQSTDSSLAVFASALNEFSKRVGAGELNFDESGVCRMMIDDLLQIDIEHDAQRECLHLYWIVKQADPLQMMEANYEIHRDGGARFLYDTAADEYVLHDTILLASAVSGHLDDRLEDFAKLILHWQEKLAGAEQPQASTDTASGVSV